MKGGAFINVCPFCRVYDPARLVHYRGCPWFRGHGPIVLPAVVAAHWRRRAPVVLRGA